MSLTKNPEMTPEKIAANQANGRLSNGPATPEGLERVRDANTKHYYRDTMLAPTHPQARLMLRSEDSNFRKVERLTTMLMKRRARMPSPIPAPHTQYEGTTHDVDENKGP